MVLTEVRSRSEARDFIELPVRLYREVPEWIRPLDKDIESVFNPEINKSFRDGECCRWVLSNPNGEVVGRVAAFIQRKLVHKGNDQPTGGMGFFECIRDQSAAFMLFDKCKEWLSARGMEAMDGPINFGSRERWWGLLVEGYDKEPNYLCNYHLPYYKEFFENYGFKLYFSQLTYARKTMDPPSPRLAYKASLLANDPNYVFRRILKPEYSKLPALICTVYNKAWANRSEVPEMTLHQAKLLVKQMRPILDSRMLWFGFYKDEPISFFLSLPEINQWLKYVDGSIKGIGLLKFLWARFFKPNHKAFGLLFGVVPEHQGTGADGAMIMEAKKVFQGGSLPYSDYEMNWIGDFNPKMIQVVEQVGGYVGKRHITYRKLFDESKPFKRYPILN